MKHLLLLLLLVSSAAAQVVVTGTVTNANGTVATSGTVEFKIVPASTAIAYRIAGTNVIAPQTGTCGINASGLVKNVALTGDCRIWGNDAIVPANTCYDVTYKPAGVQTNVIRNVRFTGATANLASPTLCQQVNVVPQYVTVTTNPFQVNILPSIDSTFTVGSSGLEYAHGYFDQLTIGGTSLILGYAKLASNQTFTGINQFSQQLSGIDNSAAVDGTSGGDLKLYGGPGKICGGGPCTSNGGNIILLPGLGDTGRGSVLPDVDNTIALGNSAKRWSSFNTFNLVADGSITGAIVNGAYNTAKYASLQATITAAGTSGKVVLPCGTYTSIVPVTVTTNGVFIEGYGLCSVININHVGDGFDITGTLFKLRDVEIQVGTASNRSGAAIFDIQNGQGTIENVRITGNGASANNGIMFKMENALSDSWSFGRIRMSGGHTWQSAWRMMGTANTIASTRIVDLGGNPLWTDAMFDIDGAIDTLQISTMDTPGMSGKIFRVRNTVGGIVDPRWIQCSNCSIEAAGSTAIELVNSQDFTYHGYIATATVGVDIGANAKETDISAVQFTNINENAVIIRNGSIGTNVVNNFFTGTGLSAGIFDSILVKADADDFNISGNRWRAGATIPQTCIEIEAGNTNNYILRDNACPATARSGASVVNAATGGSFVVENNTAHANKYGYGVTSTWNDSMIGNASIIARAGVQNDGGNLAFTSSTGIQTAQALELATSAKIGANGTAITQYRVYSTAIDIASVAANTSVEQTFAVAGLAVADKCFVNKPTVTAGLIVSNCRVSAVDTIALTLGNLTAAPIDPGSETYAIVTIRN